MINFVLPKDQALKQVEEENLSTKTLISNTDKQKGQSDEADKSRTQVIYGDEKKRQLGNMKGIWTRAMYTQGKGGGSSLRKE